MLEVQLFQSIFYKSVSVMKMIYEKALHLRCSVALKLIKSSARNRSRSNDGTIDSTGETHRFISKRKRKEETERGECLCILLLTPPPSPAMQTIIIESLATNNGKKQNYLIHFCIRAKAFIVKLYFLCMKVFIFLF
jgi:hypothetical protein